LTPPGQSGLIGLPEPPQVVLELLQLDFVKMRWDVWRSRQVTKQTDIAATQMKRERFGSAYSGASVGARQTGEKMVTDERFTNSVPDSWHANWGKLDDIGLATGIILQASNQTPAPEGEEGTNFS